MKILTVSFNKPLHRKRRCDKIVTGWSLAKNVLAQLGHTIIDRDFTPPAYFDLLSAGDRWDLALVYVDDPRGRTSGYALQALEFISLSKKYGKPVATYIGNARFDDIMLGIKNVARSMYDVEREKPKDWYGLVNTSIVIEAASAPLPNLMVHAFPWHDFSVFERLAGYKPSFIWDPTPVSCPFVKEKVTPDRERIWVDANLRKQKPWWRTTWPVEEHRDTPEDELFQRYTEVEGVLTQRYWAYPTAWWRHRFVMALEAGAVLGIHQEEGSRMDPSFAMTPGTIEQLDQRGLAALNLQQLNWFKRNTWNTDQVYEAFTTFMQRFQ